MIQLLGEGTNISTADPVRGDPELIGLARFGCDSGMVPIGFGARSGCLSIKDFRVQPHINLYLSCIINSMT